MDCYKYDTSECYQCSGLTKTHSSVLSFPYLAISHRELSDAADTFLNSQSQLTNWLNETPNM